MAKTKWGGLLGVCTEVAGSVVALPVAVARGAYTAANGEGFGKGFEKGAEAAVKVVEKAAEKAQDFGDKYAGTLTAGTLHIVMSVAKSAIQKGMDQPPSPPRQLGS
jgi:hypothetical protein